MFGVYNKENNQIDATIDSLLKFNYIMTNFHVFFYHYIFIFAMFHTTSCILQSNAPEDGHNYYPKNVELTLEF